MKKRLLTLLLGASLLAGAVSAQAPKRELRSTWLATVWAIDWPASKSESAAKQQMQDYLDDLAANNFNGVCFQVRGLADAMYRSSYEPWNSVLTGTRGKDPGWDPLEWVVDQCHQRGLECYAWVNPYRESSSGKIQNTDIDREWQDKGWLLSNGSYIVFNPGIADARAHILRVIKEIYTNYAIDGILFDDYFYPSGGTVENSTAPDWDLYKASGTALSIGDWRRKNINDFMKEIYDNIQIDRPDIRFGISPAGVAGKSSGIYGTPGIPVSAGDWQYDQIYSDPIAWLHDGAVDFISPQIYWKTTNTSAPFGPLTNWWSQVAGMFGRHFYASHSISLLMDDNSVENWEDIARQIELHRTGQNTHRGQPGSIFYSAKNLDGNGSGGVGGLGNYLYQHTYPTKSLVPVISWKDHPTYGAPSGLKFANGKLTWTPVNPAKGQSVIRYSVYAIPSNMVFERAADIGGDGISAEYLVGISYSGEYTLPADKARSHYYAVCVYDGYGYESEPALVNYNSEPSKPTTLIAPADGSSVDWNPVFSWNTVEGATYDLEVSPDATFRKAVISLTGIKGSSTTVDLSSLKGSTTYYWRVFTVEPDRISSASNVFSFVTPERPVGNFEQGYKIVTDDGQYASIGDYTLSSLWFRSIRDGFDNFPVTENGTLNRGMVATDDYVYVCGRSLASENADLYLQVYNAITGEHERDLALSENGRCGYLPANDLIRDNADNLLLTNLSLDISKTPIKFFLVNTETGELSQAASVTGTEKARVDHAGVYGDITSGDFTIFAAAASGNAVYRWHFSNGSASAMEKMTVSDFHPAGGSNFGIAPKVFPIDDNEFYLDGGATSLARYSFSSGKLVDCPATTAAHYNDDTMANGFDNYYLGGSEILVYSAGSHEGDGFRFNIVDAGADNNLAKGSLMWKVPANTLGKFNSTTLSAPVSITGNGNVARIYIYVPGNGLAAYTLTHDISSLTDISDAGRRVNLYGNVAVFETKQDFIKAYNMSGALVTSETDASEAVLPGTGVYVVVTPDGAVKVTVD